MDAFSEERRQAGLFPIDDVRQIEAEIRIAPPQKPTDDTEAIGRIFNSLQRHRRLILYTVAVGGLLVAIAFLVFPPSYLAKAQLILDLHRSEAVNANAPGVVTIVPQNVEDAAIDTHITTLLSDANLRRTLQALDADGKDSDTTDKTATATVNAALTQLRRGLKVIQERRSRIISVGYDDPDPARAAKVANTVVQVYVDALRREKRDDAELAVSRFTHRLAAVRDDVARAENAVHVFRQDHVANESATPDQTELQISQTAHQLALLKSSAASIEKRLGEFHKLQRTSASTLELARLLDSARLIELGNLAERMLKARPNEKDTSLPDLLRAIDRETAASVSRLEVELQTYQTQVQSVEDRLELLRHASAQAAKDTIGLRELERRASALGQLYETLLRQRQDLVERSKLAEPDIRILALAEPPLHPASLKRVFLIPPAMVAFTLLGCMIALALDRLDHTLRGVSETTEALQVPCIGLAPGLTLNEAKSIPQLLRNQYDAPYSKAIRSIFTATASLCRPGREHKVILVTSSLRGEGKTNLAWSLAVSAAQIQWNVLLLEIGPQTSPLRSQEIESVVFPTSAVTLSDAISREGTVVAAAGWIPESGINFLPLCGHQNFLPFLASADFPRLIDEIRHAYDLVIIDAPPVSDGSEINLLAAKADKILFAVQWGRTRRETARAAIQLIQTADSTSSEKIGTVLTKVNLRKHAGYRFSDQGDFLKGANL